MRKINLRISICRFAALCAVVAAVFMGTGVLIGRAFARSEPSAAEREAASNTAGREQKPLGQPAGYSQALAEPDLCIEDTYGYRQFTATAYCKCRECNGRWGTSEANGAAQSATGAHLAEGVSIAADFSVLPPYTQVEISGMGVYTVHDCGGAVKGNRIDVYFENHEDAESFGVQTVWLRVLEEK